MQFESISVVINKIIQFAGLPWWTFLSLSLLGIVVFYFYFIKFPITIIRLKKDVVKQSEKIKTLKKKIESSIHRVPSYKWKN